MVGQNGKTSCQVRVKRRLCKQRLEPTYSAVTGVTGLSKLMCGSQRVPGEQSQVGSCWTVLSKTGTQRSDVKYLLTKANIIVNQ